MKLWGPRLDYSISVVQGGYEVVHSLIEARARGVGLQPTTRCRRYRCNGAIRCVGNVAFRIGDLDVI